MEYVIVNHLGFEQVHEFRHVDNLSVAANGDVVVTMAAGYELTYEAEFVTRWFIRDPQPQEPSS